MDPNHPGAMRAHIRRQFQPGRAPELLYGVVVTSSVLAISSLDSAPDDRVAVAATFVSIVYWLAHVYVDAVGGRFADQDHTVSARLADALRTNSAVLLGSIPPIVVYVMGRILGLGVREAAWLALWFTVALLTVAAGLAAYRAGARRWALVAESAVAGGFGLAVIALKFLMH